MRKLFGTVGDYTHGTLVNKKSSLCAPHATYPVPEAEIANFVWGYDFEGFSKTATESGINISDRALNVSMQLQTTTNGKEVAFHTFAMCDCMLYLGIDGSLTTRI